MKIHSVVITLLALAWVQPYAEGAPPGAEDKRPPPSSDQKQSPIDDMSSALPSHHKRPPPSSDKFHQKPFNDDMSSALPSHHKRPPPSSDKFHQTPYNDDSSLPSISPRSLLACGSHSLAAGTYTVQSENHPQNYPINHDCDYDITAADGGQIDFECSAFNLESNSACRWDWLSVNDQKYCGTAGPPSDSFDSLTLSFHSDYSVVRSGFLCSLTVADGGTTGGSETGCDNKLACGEHVLEDGEYIIESPNHPENYDVNHECSYALSADNSAHDLSIACAAFELESHSSCAWDWLNVNGQKYCGTNGPSSSSTGNMQIDFMSDYSVVRTGYQCTITVAAGDGGGGGGGGGGGESGDCCCGLPNRATRIVGGEVTEVYEYPWQVGLVSPGGTRTYCGGSVINNRYVLTAAHCVTGDQASDLQVLLREHIISNSDGEIRASVAEILIHPSYTSASSSGYDFALLKLTANIDFPADNTLAPICLPADDSDQYVGINATITGWGTTSSGGSQATTLREVTVPVVSNADCSSSYSSINPSMICAGKPEGGLDSCQGDSGGPMFTLETDRYIQIGVVSWGRGCALPGYPGVYARVTSALSWIQTNSASGTFCT